MNRWGPPKPTKGGNTAALKMLLSGARSLDGFTVDQLVRCYGVDRKVTEYELTVARQKRAAED
jgi:hypothetical protein